jgi:hypothetical protein
LQSKKKKSIHLENKRSASVHTSASSETRFQDFQGDQCIAHGKGNSKNKVDHVMKKENLDVEMKV